MKQIAAVILIAAACAAPALADNGLISKPSQHDVTQTIDRLESALKAEKFQVFSRVDFQALAAENGGKVRPNQILIFGRGGILPSLLTVAPVAAVDLPFKVLAWEDDAGKVWVTYNSADYFRERHAISGNDDLIKRIGALMDKFVSKAAD